MYTKRRDNPFRWHVWLPTRGNVLFTLLVLGGLFWAVSAGALPLQLPATTSAATSASSTTINYQGYLTDAASNPVNDTLDVVFHLYNLSSGGSSLWSETHNGVVVTDGLFSVLLGSVTPIPTQILTENSDLWLGITVGSDQEMMPREKIASAPYAMVANVPDGSIITAKLADNAITTAKIANAAVGSSDVADNSLTATDLAANSVGISEIAGGAVATSELANNAVTSAKIQDGQVSSSDIANNTVSETDIADSFKARDADKLDGHDTSYFATASHNHDGRYYTESESDSRFVNASGDGMSGDLDMNGHKLMDLHDLESSGDLVLTPGSGSHIVISANAYTIRPSAQGGVDIGHPDFKFNAIWGQQNFIGALIETGLETPQEQIDGIASIDEGDVLCWNKERLEKCREANTVAVQAVASDERHPIVLGAELIKVLGVVKVNDLLVASDVPGYAMVNNAARPGTVIGQALEDFDGEQGLIKAMIRKF